MNDKERLFRAASQDNDLAEMRRIAEEALKNNKSSTERTLWRRRLEAVRQGRMIKFGRGELEDIR